MDTQEATADMAWVKRDEWLRQFDEERRCIVCETLPIEGETLSYEGEFGYPGRRRGRSLLKKAVDRLGYGRHTIGQCCHQDSKGSHDNAPIAAPLGPRQEQNPSANAALHPPNYMGWLVGMPLPVIAGADWASG